MLPVSNPARRALLLAQEEAQALRHSYIGTEHILLGLLREEDGLAAQVLTSLGVEYEPVRAAVVRMLGLGVEEVGEELPSTGPAASAVERAGREASMLGAEQIGTEHILMALMRDPGGAAARILLQLDVDPVAVRAAISAAGS